MEGLMVVTLNMAAFMFLLELLELPLMQQALTILLEVLAEVAELQAQPPCLAA
jgi:hypothetical protein